MQIVVQQFTDNEAGRFMMACTECHLRVNDDIVFYLRNVVVKGAVNDTAVANDNGLEEILLPFLIPVFVFRFLISIFHLCIGQRKIGKSFFEGILTV